MKFLRLLPVLILANILSTSAVQAVDLPEKCNDQGKCYGTLTAVPVLFANVLAVITVLAGFAAFTMLIFGGFRFIIAQGDPKAVQAARGTLTWAVVGLVMIIVSWLILLFLSQFLGLNLTQFCFGVKADGSPCY